MPSLSLSDFADNVVATLNDLGPPKFQQIAQDVVDYPIFRTWFKKGKVSFLPDGIGITRSLMVRTAGVASHGSPTASDNVAIHDLLKSMNVSWAHAKSYWAFFYQQSLINRGKSMITNVIEPQRAGALIDLAKEVDSKAWANPDPSADSQPLGIPHWIVKASGTPSHQGGLPSGYTTVAGINLTTVPNFKNWTGQYVNVSKADLVKKLKTAKRRCQFRSPINIDQYVSEMGERYQLYVNETTIGNIEDVGESQNENLGRDIDSLGGQIVFQGHPIMYVPQLDSDTTNPVYMIDHNTFYPCVLTGDYLRESGPEKVADNHNSFAVFLDLTYQYICLDRRRNAVLYV